MSEKPIIVKNFRNTQYSFRDTNTEKFLGPKIISPNRWLSEKKRIEESLEKNKIFFSEASNDKNKVLKLRER